MGVWIRKLSGAAAVSCMLAGLASAQYQTTPGSGYGGAANLHRSFDSPEGWALKYFASSTLLSGLQPPEPSEGRRFGTFSLGLELGWMPTLDAGQSRVGFNGT